MENENELFTGRRKIDVISYELMHGGHALVAGATGSGKSTLIETFLYNLCQQSPNNFQFVIIDLKRVSLTRWKKAVHCKYYAITAQQAEYIIDCTLATMEQRLKEMEKTETQKFTGTKLFLIIDESADLLETNKNILPKLTRLFRLSRCTNIFCILCSQSPSKRSLPACLQENTTTLIALRCRDKIASRQIIGAAGAETLPKHGKCLYYTPDTITVKQADVIRTDDGTIENYINKMLTAGYIPQPLQPKRKRKFKIRYKPLILKFLDYLYN